MARMIPPHPRWPAKNRKGEERVFTDFQRHLGPEFTVFYQLFWLRRDRSSETDTDFTLIHPMKGLLVLEVKGGNRHAVGLKNGQFTKKNPLLQAKGSATLLRRFLDARHNIMPFAQQCAIMHAICLPYLKRDGLNLPPDIDKVTLTKDDFADATTLNHAIDALYALQPTPQAIHLTPPEVQLLADHLESLTSPGLTFARLFAEDQQAFHELLATQKAAIIQITQQRRCDVNGGAGTGKTTIAFEVAARLAEDGKKVLFLCRTPNQTQWLRGDLHHVPAFFLRKPLFTIIDIQEMCRQLNAAAPNVPRRNFFDNTPPSTIIMWLRESLDALAASAPADISGVQQVQPPYDAILVDETQDFPNAIFPDLLRLLKDPATSQFHIFRDEMQREQEGPLDVAFMGPDCQTIDLWPNLRNRPEIYELMCRVLQPNLHVYPARAQTSADRRVIFAPVPPLKKSAPPASQ